MQARSHGAVSAAISTEPAKPSSPHGASPSSARDFPGTALAIQLLSEAAAAASPRHLRIALVDPRAEIGAGVAYATRDYPYPLNVAAGQMSLDGAQPRRFPRLPEAQGIHAAAGDYLPRQVYGDYLRARFARSARGSADDRRVRAPPRQRAGSCAAQR